MSLSGVHYPHSLTFPSIDDIMRFSSVDGSLQYNMIKRMGGGDPFPCFVGAASSNPTVRFTTSSARSVLNTCTEYNVARDLSGVDVDLLFRRGKPQGFRELLSAAKHVGFQLQESALLWWDSFTATEDEDTEFQCQLLTARKDTSTDPWVATGSQTIAAPKCQELYSLGPVVINGRMVGSVHQVDWQNNITPYTRRTALSPKDPAWQSLQDMQPVVTFRTNDLEELMYATPANDAYGGSEMFEVRVYLRRRKSTSFFELDNASSHIELRMYGGWKGGVSFNGATPSECSIEFHPAQKVDANNVVSQDALIYRFLDTQIPTTGVAPTLANFGTVNVTNNNAVFIMPDLQAGGLPYNDGNGYVLQVGSLPTGAVLNTSSGVIDGVVTSGAGSFPVTIRAVNAQGNSDATLTIEVA